MFYSYCYDYQAFFATLAKAVDSIAQTDAIAPAFLVALLSAVFFWGAMLAAARTRHQPQDEPK